MSETPHADLQKLAAHLRTTLDEKAKRPEKSPFVLLYAFNGTGKTRLSSAFKNCGKERDGNGEARGRDTLYFNAFTEDLFSWDNDLENDALRTLTLNTASKFFNGLHELEISNKIRILLNRYADFDFKIEFGIDVHSGKYTQARVIFSREVRTGKGDNARTDMVDGIKISRGEESIFIWCFFLAVLQLALDGDDTYSWVKYVFIDDPISSLDEHNAIVVGNHLVQLYCDARRPIKTVVSTHHALFFNVIYYELKSRSYQGPVLLPLRFTLKRDVNSDGYLLAEIKVDTPQFYHVAALADLWKVAHDGGAQTYHFNILRTVLEKTALFLGHDQFSKCIKRDSDDADGILHERFVNLLSHGKYSMYEPVEMGDDNKKYFLKILRGFVERHPFNPELLPKSAGDEEQP